MASDWTQRLLAIDAAIVGMGTFQSPATSDLANLTWGEWQLERAKRIAAACDAAPTPTVPLPEEVATTIRNILEHRRGETWKLIEDYGSLLASPEQIKRIDAALAWLVDAQGKNTP